MSIHIFFLRNKKEFPHQYTSRVPTKTPHVSYKKSIACLKFKYGVWHFKVIGIVFLSKITFKDENMYMLRFYSKRVLHADQLIKFLNN